MLPLDKELSDKNKHLRGSHSHACAVKPGIGEKPSLSSCAKFVFRMGITYFSLNALMY